MPINLGPMRAPRIILIATKVKLSIPPREMERLTYIDPPNRLEVRAEDDVSQQFYILW